MTEDVYVLMRYEGSDEPAIVGDPEPIAVFRDEKIAHLYGKFHINFPYYFEVVKVQMTDSINLIDRKNRI